jgi:hypothetical protein
VARRSGSESEAQLGSGGHGESAPQAVVPEPARGRASTHCSGVINGRANVRTSLPQLAQATAQIAVCARLHCASYHHGSCCQHRLRGRCRAVGHHRVGAAVAQPAPIPAVRLQHLRRPQRSQCVTRGEARTCPPVDMGAMRSLASAPNMRRPAANPAPSRFRTCRQPDVRRHRCAEPAGVSAEAGWAWQRRWRCLLRRLGATWLYVQHQRVHAAAKPMRLGCAANRLPCPSTVC